VCSLSQFKNYIKLNKKIDYDQTIKNQIEMIIISTIKSAADNLEHKSNCFELYGFDIILDQNY
jgi:hypothetical protein